MDLGAYAQINDLNKILIDNNICIPRLRGLRWMGNEKPINEAEIIKTAKDIGLYYCDRACCSDFTWNTSWVEFSSRTMRLEHKYFVYDKNEIVDIRWDKIHGKKRKLFKYEMKMAKRRAEANFNMFNSYVGRKDILYIHARIGGESWAHYRTEIENQPWFITKNDDPFDSTYCDIYAKIKIPEEAVT